MRLRSVQIRNFRSFQNETFFLSDLTSLLGPNGAGKSSVLAALNVFFQEPRSTTDVASLSAEDFHNGNINDPIQITVTFCDLTARAQEDLKHYVRHGELIATAEARFDPGSNRAPVNRYGERLIFTKFAPFFEDEKNRVTVEPLRARFKEVTAGIDAVLEVGSKPTKAQMLDALRGYEEANPDKCTPERSSELFYGSTKGKYKLDPYLQWVYLPAVKDASEEAEEAGNTALGKLLQRTVRKKVDFESALNELRKKAREEYDELLASEQTALEEISTRLATRLATYSHSSAGLEVVWLQGSEKSVVINDPKATIRAYEGLFKGSLLRFGHGLQRAFLLTILQELALIESESASETGDEQPTLIFACEEPELYQHPPQARHLSTVLRTLSESGGQVLLTTHSPYFVSGESFEEIRLIRKDNQSGKSNVRHTNFERFSQRMAEITGERPDKRSVARAKLYAALQPERSEMFFCNKLILVEGVEDRAYVTTALLLEDKWERVRRAGSHIVPANGKSEILQLLIISQELDIPAYVVFDADGQEENERYRQEHERDNKRLLEALGTDIGPFPEVTILEDSFAIWKDEIGQQVKEEIGQDVWVDLTNRARQAFDPGVSLSKNPIFVAESLRLAWQEGHRPESLIKLSEKLACFAEC